MRALLARQTARRKGVQSVAAVPVLLTIERCSVGRYPVSPARVQFFLRGRAAQTLKESRVAYGAEGRCLIEGNQTFLIGDTQRQSLVGAVGRADVGDAYSCAPRRQCLELDNGHSH